MGLHFQAPTIIPCNEVARESAVISSGLLEADRAMALHGIVWKAARTFGTEMAGATIIYRDKEILIAGYGVGQGVSPRTASFCAQAILNPDRVLYVADAAEDVRFSDYPSVVNAPHIRFYAGAPLLSSCGQPLGALCVFDSEPRKRFTPRQEQALRGMAAEVMARGLLP